MWNSKNSSNGMKVNFSYLKKRLAQIQSIYKQLFLKITKFVFDYKKLQSLDGSKSGFNSIPNFGKLDRSKLMIECMVLTPFSAVRQLYHSSQCTYTCFPGVLLTSTTHNIPSKQLAAFPQNNCRKKDQQ